MKKNILTLLFLATTAIASAQNTTWNIDASHTNVKFTVTHLVISEVEGSFRAFDGKVTSTSPDFNNANIEFTVDVKSIDTDNEDRDKHLKSDDFFNAEKFPQMVFKSTSFKKTEGKNYVLTGDLTIRDVTKKVTFDVTYGGTVKDPWGNTKAGFKAKSKINRKDYKLMWGAVTEAGGMVVSDEVEIAINLELSQAK
ncbi:MAG: YceI family protein [Bacteroidetes bacterium]|nr:YceI family protein [Bacteroidota bacterium]